MRFIGRFLAILIVLQAVAIGAASQTAGRADAQTGEAFVYAGGDCSLDATADGKSPHRRAHAHCCVLCSIGCSDKLAFQVAVLLARAEFQPPRITISAACADGGFSMRRSVSIGSASSRGPPRFS
ncbi:MAG: hypothetical protein FD148_1654 [Methylocystaceae bacterium]|nr:MAG: hypothetical protein FD148_1654 [Methylocystaceae bacterium]